MPWTSLQGGTINSFFVVAARAGGKGERTRASGVPPVFSPPPGATPPPPSISRSISANLKLRAFHSTLFQEVCAGERWRRRTPACRRGTYHASDLVTRCSLCQSRREQEGLFGEKPRGTCPRPPPLLSAESGFHLISSPIRVATWAGTEPGSRLSLSAFTHLFCVHTLVIAAA